MHHSSTRVWAICNKRLIRDRIDILARYFFPKDCNSIFSVLRHAAQSPTNRPEKQVLRHVVACRSMLQLLVPGHTEAWESITPTRAATRKYGCPSPLPKGPHRSVGVLNSNFFYEVKHSVEKRFFAY